MPLKNQMSFKPLLSPNEDPLSCPEFFERLQYPYLCSPKYDGIRAIVKNKAVFSRTGKPLPSYQVQEEFGIKELEHCDGELIEGCATDFGVYNRTQSPQVLLILWSFTLKTLTQ